MWDVETGEREVHGGGLRFFFLDFSDECVCSRPLPGSPPSIYIYSVSMLAYFDLPGAGSPGYVLHTSSPPLSGA